MERKEAVVIEGRKREKAFKKEGIIKGSKRKREGTRSEKGRQHREAGKVGEKEEVGS